MRYVEIYEKVANELNLPVDIVIKTYNAYWKSIKQIIESLPLKDDLTKEQFDKLQTNFSIGGIGKLNCTWDRYLGVKQHYYYKGKIKNDYYKKG